MEIFIVKRTDNNMILSAHKTKEDAMNAIRTYSGDGKFSFPKYEIDTCFFS